jgi:hypothetical protein
VWGVWRTAVRVKQREQVRHRAPGPGE